MHHTLWRSHGPPEGRPARIWPWPGAADSKSRVRCRRMLTRWEHLELRALTTPANIRVTWLIHVYDMTRACEWHDSSIKDTCVIHGCDMTHWYQGHDSFVDGTWLVRGWDMTRSWMGHDSFVDGTWLAPSRLRIMARRTCDMTHSYCWHDSFIERHDAFIERHDAFIYETWLIHTRDVT